MFCLVSFPLRLLLCCCFTLSLGITLLSSVQMRWGF